MTAWSFAGIPRTRIEQRLWRMLSPRWQHAPLAGKGAARAGGRWNAPGVPALYLSDSHATAIAEYMQALVHPGTLAPYDVISDSIFNLSDPAVRTSVGINDTILTLDWRRIRDIDKGIPESWDLATSAAAAGFDGLSFPSTQTRGVNLVLWRWGREGAKVVLVDPAGSLSG
jgi:RES domain-containing protein